MKTISVTASCFNEEGNILEFYRQVTEAFQRLAGRYAYELVIADNASTDATPQLLRTLAAKDSRVKVIFNTRNFGPDRSGYNAFLQTTGDAVVVLASDLQTPPSMIVGFVAKWEEGYKVVMGVKAGSQEPRITHAMRSLYYGLLASLSDVRLVSHFNGFGLFDREVVEILRSLDDPYPYFRGLVADIGFEAATIEYVQPARKHGRSKSSLLYLYDEAMLGMTSYTRIPLRIATVLGFVTALVSFLVGMFYLVYKLVFWSSFSLGVAPLAVGLFFFSAVQLIFLGVIGEYIAMIYTQVLHRPLVYEKERLNF